MERSYLTFLAVFVVGIALLFATSPPEYRYNILRKGCRRSRETRFWHQVSTSRIQSHYAPRPRGACVYPFSTR